MFAPRELYFVTYVHGCKKCGHEYFSVQGAVKRVLRGGNPRVRGAKDRTYLDFPVSARQGLATCAIMGKYMDL